MDNSHFENEETVKEDLEEIKKVFNTDSILRENYTNSRVQKYYKYSSFAYSRYHSKEGSVHIALNYDGIYSPEGHYRQADEINDLIIENSKVLELGCGKGFNTSRLANKNKTSQFYGIDISEAQLNYARKTTKNTTNLSYFKRDFQNTEFDNDTFDVVFAIESVCYSEDLDGLLKEVNRIIKKGGKFVIYDAFRTPNLENRSNTIKDSVSLCEKAMAVNSFFSIFDWIKTSESNGFEVTQNDDISLAVMPNLKKLYASCKNFIKNKFKARVIYKIAPSDIIKTSISGIFMPHTIMQKTVSYNRIIMTKVAQSK